MGIDWSSVEGFVDSFVQGLQQHYMPFALCLFAALMVFVLIQRVLKKQLYITTQPEEGLLDSPRPQLDPEDIA